ncbi:unnamed protein product [Prorocentrum cordatum]|uniref:Uncharacterized protein n=1 Tax=Prorocentrum cordatum TaxID=2364126 RepID=A0ABN9WX18_9DINO|nr:unnamed protein product [Polarella glacialis]
MAGLVRSCSRAKILPVTTGIIRNAGTCLALEHGCMTDARAEAMSSTIRASSAGVREARLRSNGLSQQGAAYLLEALPEDVVSVDISQNSLGHDASALCRALSRLTNLRSLSMSDSQIHDSGCKALMGCLAACKQLVSLDLSGNSIYHGGAQIGSFVERHRTLESLDVHWNHISGDSGRDLARGIRENGSAAGALRNVNLSWNPLGKAGGEDTCRQLAQAFSLGKLEHVDLKNCDLSAALCRILADGMRENTSVLGIHIEGNGLLEMPGDGWVGARVDPWGFLLVRLSYVPGISGPELPPGAPTAWVFTSADSFARGVRMTRFGEELVAYLMAPRGQLLYCFQVGGRLLTSATSRLAPELAVGMRPRRVRREPVGGEGAAGPLEADVVRFNALQVSQRPAGERACRWLVPRRPGELRAGDGGRPAEWHVERSLFAHHEDPLRHQGFCERRFEVDWGLASCAELVGEDEDAVRDFLGRAYGEVQMLYSSFCSVDWENAQRRPSDRQWPLSFGVTLHEYAHLLVQGALLTGEFGLGEADAHFVIAAAAPSLLAARKAAARAAQWRHDVLHSEVVEADAQTNLWDRTWLWRASAMERFDETRSTDHLELWFVEFLEAMARLAALLRSRALAGGPDDAPEAGRAEDGLGPVPPAFAFGLDKDGVMDKDAFAGHLDAFLGSAAVRAAARPPSGGAAPA